MNNGALVLFLVMIGVVIVAILVASSNQRARDEEEIQALKEDLSKSEKELNSVEIRLEEVKSYLREAKKEVESFKFSQGDNGRYYVGVQVLEYRHIVESVLGRELRYNEEVHHLNQKNNDNHLYNLCVMTKVNHELVHAWLDRRSKKKQFPSFAQQRAFIKNLKEPSIFLDEAYMRKHKTNYVGALSKDNRWIGVDDSSIFDISISKEEYINKANKEVRFTKKELKNLRAGRELT